MTAEFYPLQVLLLALSGWANREQQRTIEYLGRENRVLKEQLKGRRIRRDPLWVPFSSSASPIIQDG